MSKSYSPLRYPGGKAKLYNLVKKVLIKNDLLGGTYVEPFAGGAGLAIKLLMENDVKRIVLNDLDPAIFCFWKVILNQTDDFCKYIDQVELTIDEWKRQRDFFKKGNNGDELQFAFSVFYLNRTNISGILNGGVIGGINQKGTYKIDARFNKENLKKRIREISSRKNDIVLYDLDAKELISGGYLKKYRKVLINFDPPYVNKGDQLYKNSFKQEDHLTLFQSINKCKKKWIVTYDVCDLISKLYSNYRRRLITLNYSANNKTVEHEYIVFSNNLEIPDDLLCGGSEMNCKDTCRFCSILKGEKYFDIIDTPIIENDDYYLLSSVGAMVEGWSLIVPKEHQYSMKEHYSNSKFYDFANRCISVIEKAYCIDRVIIFEHGANKFGSMTACGTNHCHIHIVPFSDSLQNDINDYFPFKKTTFDKVSAIAKDSEYLLYADVLEKIDKSDCYIHVLQEPISQFFRRIIAAKLGCPNQYNYKENKNLEISNATYKTLQKEIENG